LRAATICSSVKRLRRISSSFRSSERGRTAIYSGTVLGEQVTPSLIDRTHYHRYRFGHQGGITQHVWWNQETGCDKWSKIHTGNFCNTSGGFWEMTDNVLTPYGYYILVDVILFNPATPTQVC